MAENIVIDEATLTRLKTEYATLLDDIDTRMSTYKWGNSPGSRLNLDEQFPLRLGGADFAAAVSLAKDLEKIRQNLTGRIGDTYTNASNLRWGLEYLLADTNHIEPLNKMTAEEFESYIPTSTTTPGSGSSSGSGS
ncbi:conserved hypothetical protein [Frankia canadensis]|uniref:Uncharacterized protein n=1 Tax=Frankia canadensis TaxID=1836972 RepID=A0A2I2KKZ1_9ACTN|nr:hypothetical protein [Frankia canadensis]SNQ46307.1 conserved hypothetical protein [Frankia canadensis]SOU53597.1 conserved hypothetical protein [Frankia canadensis]